MDNGFPEVIDNKETEDLLHLVEERYGIGFSAQQRVFAEMEQCRLAYRGDQWQNLSGTRWAPAPEHKWRIRLVINKLIPLVDLYIATMLKNKPIIIANPASNELADRISSEISENLLKYYWSEHKYDVNLVDVLRNVGVLGSGFLRFSWDNDAGQVIDGSPSGDVVMDSISPFSIVIEPGATRFEQARWCVVTEFLGVDELEKKFNTKIEPERPAEARIMATAIAQNVPQGMKDRAPLYQMYERPTKDFPNGRLVCKANNKILSEEELPRGDIRIVHFRGLDLPGEFWPTSMVSQVFPLQMELNKGRSQLVELRNLQSRPPIIVPIGSIPNNEPVYIPGRKIPFDPRIAGGILPQPMAPTQVPQWVLSLLSMAESDIMDLSSKHEISQGQQVGSVRSASQANILQQADESRLSPQIRQFEESLKMCGKYTLRYVQENKEGPQVLPIVGETMRAEVYSYNQSDLTDNCNVSYEIASQLPWTRDAMRQNAIYLNSIGKLDDDALWKILPSPTVQGMYRKDVEHVQNARLENEMLGQAYFDPFPSDNDEVHIKEHEAFVNRPEIREQHIQEIIQEQQVSGIDPEMVQQDEEPGPKPPASAKNIYKHIQAHKQRRPKPEKEQPKVRVNVSSDDISDTPEGKQLVADVIAQSTDVESGGQQQGGPEEQQEQPKQNNPSPPSVPTGPGM